MANLQLINQSTATLIKVAQVVNPQWDDTAAERYVLSELSFLKERILNDYGLNECTDESLIQCVRKALRDNVSLNKSANLVYVQPQSVQQSDGTYVKVAHYSLTVEGKISIAKQSGELLDITRPKLYRNSDGRIIRGEVEVLKPSYPKPRWETIDFDESDIKRWQDASTKKNNGKTNPLYVTGPGGGIDSEFMRAKIIKHALSKGFGINFNKIGLQKTNPILQIEEVQPDPENDNLFLDAPENNNIDLVENATNQIEENDNFLNEL
jgi:hypothetical protein